jgi:hypothetical protein
VGLAGVVKESVLHSIPTITYVKIVSKDGEKEMKKALFYLLVLAFFAGMGTISTHAQKIAFKFGYIKGEQFLKLNQNDKAMYAMGIYDGILLAPFFGANRSDIEWMEDCTNSWSANQLSAILEKFLQNNPQRWHEPMNMLSYIALSNACGKKPK